MRRRIPQDARGQTSAGPHPPFAPIRQDGEPSPRAAQLGPVVIQQRWAMIAGARALDPRRSSDEAHVEAGRHPDRGRARRRRRGRPDGAGSRHGPQRPRPRAARGDGRDPGGGAGARSAKPADLAKVRVKESGAAAETLAQAVDLDGDAVPDQVVFLADFAPKQSRTFELTLGDEARLQEGRLPRLRTLQPRALGRLRLGERPRRAPRCTAPRSRPGTRSRSPAAASTSGASARAGWS